MDISPLSSFKFAQRTCFQVLPATPVVAMSSTLYPRKLKVAQLRLELKKRKLDHTGKKAVLIERLEKSIADGMLTSIEQSTVTGTGEIDIMQESRSPTNKVQQKLAPIFQRASSSHAWRRQCVLDILTLKNAAMSDRDEFLATDFFKAFVHLTYPLLKVASRAANVERCIEFVCDSVLAWDSQTVENADTANEGTLPVPFAADFVSHFLTLTRAQSATVRFRSCQIVANIINGFREDADIDSLWDPIVDTMLERTKDTNVNCRMFAITALKRLHEPDDPKNKATKEFQFLMESDTSDRVRMAALNNVGMSRTTLSSILLRLRDKDEKVRVKAFSVLNECVAMNHLTLDQRMEVLSAGFDDRSTEVQQSCRLLVTKSWFKQRGHSPEKLLQALDIESTKEGEDIGFKVAQSLIVAAFSGSNELMAKEGREKTQEYEVYQAELTPEAALFWRAQCEMFEGTAEFSKELKLNEDQRTAKLDNLVGSLVGFCDRISKVWKSACLPSSEEGHSAQTEEEKDFNQMFDDMEVNDSSDDDVENDQSNKAKSRGSPKSSSCGVSEDEAVAQEFVCRQLLVTARSFDFTDEMGRQTLIRLLGDMLQYVGTPECLVRPATETYMLAHAEISECSLGLVTIVSDITVPSETDEAEGISSDERLEKESQISMLKVMIAEKRDEKEVALKIEDYGTAKRLKEEMELAQAEIVSLEEALEVETGEWRWIRTFGIVEVLLAKTRSTIANDHYIAPLIQTVIQPALSQQHLNGHPMIREGAARCLALYCLLDLSGDTAKAYLGTLLTFARLDPEVHVRTAAIRGLVDVLLVFTPLFKNTILEDGEEDLTRDLMVEAITLMREYAEMRIYERFSPETLNSIGPDFEAEIEGLKELRCNAVDGLTRLFFVGRTKRADVMKRLLLLPHSTDTEDLPSIRQTLAVFLPTFSRLTKSHRFVVAESAMGALEEIAFPTGGATYDGVKVETVGKYLLFLLGDDDQGPLTDSEMPAASFHGKIGSEIAMRVLTEPEHMEFGVKGMIKILGKLKIPEWDFINSRIVRVAAEIILANEERFTDKTGRNALAKVVKLLGCVEDDLTESQCDACNVAQKAFECAVEKLKPVALENSHERAARRRAEVPKTARKTASKKRGTTVKKPKRRRKLKNIRRTSLLDDENAVELNSMLGSNFTDAMKTLGLDSGEIQKEVKPKKEMPIGKTRPSTIRAVEAMNEINNLLSSDDEEIF